MVRKHTKYVLYILATFLIFVLLISPLSLTAQKKEIGYKEFNLGISKKSAQGYINSLYKEKKIGYLKNGNIVFHNNDTTSALFIFDHNNFLYKIVVKIKFGKAQNLKAILEKRYGPVNNLIKEQYYPGDKRYLVARWLFNDKYKVTLFESEYCRSSKLIPCTLKVIYIDQELLQKKNDYDKNYKKSIKEKELQKKYDGF